MLTLVRLVIAAGMLLVVPLGLRLVTVPAWVRRWWLAAAAPAAAGLWLPRGTVAVVTVLGYAAATAVLAALAARRLATDRTPRGVAVATALASPAVAAAALVAERAGHQLFGFELPVLVLTVAHFHFAGFAAALVAGLAGRAVPGRAADVAALTVPAGTALVFLGFFTGEWVELAGATVLTGGMWLAGLLTWRERRDHRDRLARTLLGVSAVVLAATMLLALSWAVGRATGLPHPSLAWMAATHGVGNALGFALCGMFARARLRAEPL